MKNSLRVLVSVAFVAALSSTAFAQGPGSGPGAGPGPGASAPRMVPGSRMGQGGGMQRGGPRWGKDSTPGWAMMNDEERKQHREKMQSMKSHGECTAYMEQHHQQMMERAKAKGMNMPGKPRRDACAGMK